MAEASFDISRFSNRPGTMGQYERQLQRLRSAGKEVVAVESAVRDALRNLQKLQGRSFVIYGEPQSGKTEMMICLTAKLLDEGFNFIVHLLNDSVDLLGQNLGRFKASGLAPAARNFSEIIDPAVVLKGQSHVIFCKKNGADLRKLLEKIGRVKGIVVIDDEADFASPNAKVNKGEKTKINKLISDLIGPDGYYLGVTATPARLDLNNTFDNDSNLWVDFPPHSKYTGQDTFFPLDGGVKYYQTLLPDSGSDPRHARKALFGFLVNVAYLNLYVNSHEKNYSILIHTSGKKADHKTDWANAHGALTTLIQRSSADFEKYTKQIWTLSRERFPDADSDSITSYVLDNITRHSIVVLNSERDWKDNSSAATSPTSLFTIIIGGNIVSRGVTLDNLLSMYFTRDVQHKIQQDTYIQRARMFGSRGEYLNFFELTIPQGLYLDWHRCFVFHRLALAAIKEGLGSLVWLGDTRIQAVSSASIDHSTVDLDRGEMAFSLFPFSDQITQVINGSGSVFERMEQLAAALGPTAFPDYLLRYIRGTSSGLKTAVAIHDPISIAGYTDGPDIDKDQILRKRGFIANPSLGSRLLRYTISLCSTTARVTRG
ncbi:Z1 domain-containing protein [Mesorhizobium sp. WSM4904]|uniref:Z1 domain-containing protein n=1 Tax=Mesorhizobium sp. WSM4904 TaxID=3038545 RepID=UPI002418299D|nr:Z1 domain-containing protein [Mesorhizobium sp. WSM4904]WFP63678.1 Z1 domain-containing protein [Mesorhizobium sp. WSM4904]